MKSQRREYIRHALEKVRELEEEFLERSGKAIPLQSKAPLSAKAFGLYPIRNLGILKADKLRDDITSLRFRERILLAGWE